MKKKQVLVVKKIEKVSPKKEIYVSRKAQTSLGNAADVEETFVGNSSPQHPIRDSTDIVISRSILGDPRYFESLDESRASDEHPSLLNTTGKGKLGTLSRAGTANSSVLGGLNSTGSRKSFTKSGSTVVPDIDKDQYIDSLKAMTLRAKKVRTRELEREASLVQYLPVNERFDLNKEGKVLAMWQERQNKWNGIQKRLGKKVGTSATSLVMNSGDEYRARNEEYDILQAAIPVQERFGADSWQMQLRDGTERSVSIGHVFSGLTCGVSIKRVVPPAIRKPKRMGRKKLSNTFVDPTPSLLHRQKQLHKTLVTLRPHNLGPAHVEGLIIDSQSLFEWAIQSSEEYFSRKSDTVVPDECNTQEEEIENQQNSNQCPSGDTTQILFLSPRNILFNCEDTGVAHQAVMVKNTGTTAITYVWKAVPEKELHEPSDVADVMLRRQNSPRCHTLSKARSYFHCFQPTGQILPGDSVATMFSFSSRGMGGSFHETWMLDTLPRAIVSYQENPQSGLHIDNTKPKVAATLPSTVYIKLKGHANTFDEDKHLRDQVALNVSSQCRIEYLKNEAYLSVRRVRSPVSISALKERKVAKFIEINGLLLAENCSFMAHPSGLHLTYDRFEEFINMWAKTVEFVSNLQSLYSDRIASIPSSLGIEVSGESCCTELSNLLDKSQKSARDLLFPEKNLEVFDSVTEEDISLNWDMDLCRFLEITKLCIELAECIMHIDVAVAAAERDAEKKRIRAARVSADSDEDEDEEEDIDDEDEEDNDDSGLKSSDKQKSALELEAHRLHSYLTQQMMSLAISPHPELSSTFQRVITNTVDNFSDFKNESLEISSINVDAEIPIIPSAFTTNEGAEFWNSILNQDGVTGGKKSGGKSQKGAISDDQKKKYYLSMYQRVHESLIRELVSGLCAVDEVCHNSTEKKLAETGYNDLPLVSALRTEDIGINDKNTPVFVYVDTTCFIFSDEDCISEASVRIRKQEALEPVVRAVEYGARNLVLLFSLNTRSALENPSQLGSSIETFLSKEFSVLSRSRVTSNIEFRVTFVPCLPTLKHLLSEYETEIKDISVNIVNIFLLDNINSPSIVPSEIPYFEAESDDEADSIPIGLDEFAAEKLSIWKEGRPGTVAVDLPESCGNSTVYCIADVCAALSDIVKSTGGLWVEGHASHLFPSSDATPYCVTPKMFVSESVRNVAIWVGLVCQFPGLSLIRDQVQHKDMPDLSSDCDAIFSFPQFVANLFPPEIVHPKLIVTLGGNIQPEKFSMLDNLIELADTVILLGEFCVPFLRAQGVSFVQMNDVCETYTSACNLIIQKARVRGVNLLLPIDVITGDEQLTFDSPLPSVSLDNDTQDEGVDYDGESTVVSLFDDDNRLLTSEVQGFPYDVGPSTCHMLTNEIKNHHVHFSWGSAGCCEYSSFQGGQRAVISASTPPRCIESTVNSTEISHVLPYNVIVGESTVEWWSRIADSDNEYDGNIMKKGVAKLSTRNSKSVSSIICQVPSGKLSAFGKRTPCKNEWDYFTPELDSEAESDDEDE